MPTHSLCPQFILWCVGHWYFHPRLGDGVDVREVVAVTVVDCVMETDGVGVEVALVEEVTVSASLSL